MKKKILLLPLISLMLMSCVVQPSSSEENSSSLTSSTELSSSGELSSSNGEPSSSGFTSSSSEEIQDKTNINEIREIALSFTDKVNAQKVYTSDLKATFTAQLLTIHDAWTTQAGYTNRYKLLVANETGSIFVVLSNAGYDYVSKYIADQSVYTFSGLIGIYNGEPEVVMSEGSKPIYLEGTTLTYNLESLSTPVGSIIDAYQTIKNLPVNTKGTGASAQIVKMKLRYLEKLENAVALFSDGDHVIQAHGDSKMNNGLSMDETYDVFAILIIFHFKPELKFITKKVSALKLDFVYEYFTEEMSGTNLYKITYDEGHPTYASNYVYAESLIKVYHFEGYANLYTKDHAYNVVFDDQAHDEYTTKEQARNAKAMFANNKSCLTMFKQSDFDNCPFFEYAVGKKEDKVKIEFYFVAYLLNTDHYWQIQVFEDTIMEVE